MKILLGAYILLSPWVTFAQTTAVAPAQAAVTAPANAADAPAAPAPTQATPPVAPPSQASPAQVAAPAPAIDLRNDVQRLQSEYLETKNAGFTKWRDTDVTAVGALLDAIAARFADALARRQNLQVTGLATRTNIPGWGKPMEVSARSFVELGEGDQAKIVCKLDTNLGYFFFPAMVNVECLWLASTERLQLNALATSSQSVSSADPSSLGGIDLNKLELRFPDDPKSDRLQ